MTADFCTFFVQTGKCRPDSIGARTIAPRPSIPPDVCKGDPAMPSPMIYQDLTTAALLGHAAQYHSET
ncbi:hypothetical protein K25_24930, partial [Klebsiella pneumoniae]